MVVRSCSSVHWMQDIALISPIFTYLLLVYISGVRMLEDRANKKWGHLEEYKKYRKETPALFFSLK